MPSFAVDEASFAEISAALAAGAIGVAELAGEYLARIARIDQGAIGLRSVLQLNPDAMAAATSLQDTSRTSERRGALHGIPILIKDNIDTSDGMLTTAGSLALVGSRPRQDAVAVRRLRDAGAVLLGKANLSEWANFRSTTSTSGWSARGGQTHNPYVLDRSPCGSSSGSAAAVSASLCAAALGTETDGSIVCPSAVCGIVGIKPTVGLVSTSGVIPIAQSQDTVGVHARMVADAAAMLQVIAGADYQESLVPDGLRGARIGVLRRQYSGYSPSADRLFEETLEVFRSSGAALHDPAVMPSADELQNSKAELTLLYYEFHAGLDRYLAERGDPAVRSLEDVVAFNRAHQAEEMPYFGQEHMEAALTKGGLDEPEYRAARADCLRLGARDGLDAALNGPNQLDALVAVTTGPAWTIDHVNGDHDLGSSSQPAAMAGYPLITVPIGFVAGELPIGITFMGRPFSEALLIKLAYAFERATQARRRPKFLPTLAPQAT
jgi:amidase